MINTPVKGYKCIHHQLMNSTMVDCLHVSFALVSLVVCFPDTYIIVYKCMSLVLKSLSLSDCVSVIGT